MSVQSGSRARQVDDGVSNRKHDNRTKAMAGKGKLLAVSQYTG